MSLKPLLLVVSVCALSGCLSAEEARETGADATTVEQVAEHPAPGESPQVVRYETEGNLESTHDLGCMPLSKAQSDYTPADLFPAAVDCIAREKVADSVALFMLAGIYGRFDMNRVVDETAHQAVGMLIMQHFQPLSDDAKAPFSAELDRVTQDPEALAALCSSIRAVGPPDYAPRYMIQHGMKAVTFHDTGADIVEGFDPAATWNTLMSTYLHCPDA